MDERQLMWSLAWAQAVSDADLATIEAGMGRTDAAAAIWAQIRAGTNAAGVRRATAALRDRPVPPIPADVVLRCDDTFPDALREVVPAPFALWCRGDTSVLARRPAVAIVGARKARTDSLAVTRDIAAGCARSGLPVVSGLAIGIDGAAHRGALDGGGPTIAVLGGGFERLHPRSNADVATQIVERGGLLVSEYAPFQVPFKHRFLARNRIIAALASIVVVVQQGLRSGTSSTVRHALDIGVEVGVVPSFVGDAAYEGSHGLLRDGARAIVDARSVLVALGIADGGVAAKASSRPFTVSEFARERSLDVDAAVAELLDLELGGFVTRHPDGGYVLV